MKRLFRVFIWAVILAISVQALSVPTTMASAVGNNDLSTTSLLNPDGTVNLQSGYNGPLDITGYDVSLDPALGPVFRPLMTTNAWSGLGSGLNDIVYAIAINGSDVYVGGQFTDAGGNPNADRIAKWNGSSWSALGSGVSNGQVNTLAFNGSNLYVGGNFTDAGGNTSADYIAQWNGTSWSTLGNGLNNTVYAITVSGANVYVGGDFTNAGGMDIDYVAKLDGGAWDLAGPEPTFGQAPNGTVYAIAVSGSVVYIGGAFTQMYSPPSNHTYDHIVYWDSGSGSPFWQPMTDGLNGDVYSIAIFQGQVYAAGNFSNAYGIATPLNKIGRWDGSVWHDLDSGLNSFVNTMTVHGSNLYVGGNFTNAGGTASADYVARWNGDSWSALGDTPLGSTAASFAVSGLNLYTGGDFDDAGGNTSADKIALFQLDGTAPTVTAFSAPSYSSSLNVPITTFTAADNINVTAYKITESNTPPLLTDSGWTSSAPTSYAVAVEGSYQLYPWARDVHGNISAVYGSPVSVDVDVSAPTVFDFSAPSSATSLNIDISTFSASDNASVTGFTITESATPPLASDTGWSASAPTIYTIADYGSYTLYPWVKDATGNISAVYGSPVTGTACYSGNITVTSNADSGAGTLRKAIADICAGNTINFNLALSGGTIRLTSTLELLKSVTIDGSALTSRITVSGDSDDNGTGDVQVFYVANGVIATLNGLHVTRGWSNIYGGGGLRNDGTAHVINSVFSNNSVENHSGGAVFNNVTGTLAVTGSTFSGNAAYNGGAIGNYNHLMITNSTFSANTSADAGGAIYNSDLVTYNPTVTMTIMNSTFANNTGSFAGGVFSSRTASIIASTFSGNASTDGVSGGGAIWQDAETLNLSNSILANSVAIADCYSQSAMGINVNNLVESSDGSCTGSLNADPNLGSLADNGGSTQTFALLANSPAIDTGDDNTCAILPMNNFDQRGITRLNGSHCDIGAYEYVDTTDPSITAFTVSSISTSLNIPITFTASDDAHLTGYIVTESSTPPTVDSDGWTASSPTTYTVSGLGDYTFYPWAKDATGHVSAVYGWPAAVTVCLSGPIIVTNSADSGAGTLRNAIQDACAEATINFHSALSGQTIYLSSTLILTKNVTIDGSSLASQLTLSGDSDNNGSGDVRILSVLAPATLDSLILTKGQATGPDENNPNDANTQGGAIRAESPLTVSNSSFLNNSAIGHGGAIFSNAPLTILNSTFSDNSVTTPSVGYGGAVISNGVATVVNSTFSGNSSNGGFAGALFVSSTGSSITNSTFYLNSAMTGGGIMSNGDALTITNTTISDNFALAYGGLVLVGHSATLRNTIIANSTGDDCYKDAGTSLASTNNLVEDGSCSPTLSGDPKLGPLANNGGSTQTMALLSGSPGINAGTSTGCPSTDQRGMARDASCDIGAYEFVSAPGLDDFDAPVVILGQPYQHTVDVSGATQHLDDPTVAVSCDGEMLAKGHASVWYKYTPSASANVSLDTLGSNYDTYLAVWTGSRNNLSLVGCDNNTATNSQSQLSLFLTAGTPYFIEVAEYAGASPAANRSLTLHATTFADVPGNHVFWRYIEGFYSQRITNGCGANPFSYCPDAPVNRAAMAVFILRAKYGASHVPDPVQTNIFSDLPIAGQEWMQPWIEEFYEEGVTTGCGVSPRIYCPQSPVTREAMAVFLLRAKYGAGYTPPPASNPPLFADVPVAGKEWMQPWIEEFYRQGYTVGCGTSPLLYCPSATVNRAAMAVFISRVFNIPQVP